MCLKCDFSFVVNRSKHCNSSVNKIPEPVHDSNKSGETVDADQINLSAPANENENIVVVNVSSTSAPPIEDIRMTRDATAI